MHKYEIDINVLISLPERKQISAFKKMWNYSLRNTKHKSAKEYFPSRKIFTLGAPAGWCGHAWWTDILRFIITLVFFCNIIMFSNELFSFQLITLHLMIMVSDTLWITQSASWCWISVLSFDPPHAHSISALLSLLLYYSFTTLL